MNIKDKLINQINNDSTVLIGIKPTIEFFESTNKFDGEGVIGLYIKEFDMELSVFCSNSAEYYPCLADCLTQWNNWYKEQIPKKFNDPFRNEFEKLYREGK